MIWQNDLYENECNRYLKNVMRLNPMTLITGAKCVDGVVLVADRKVTSSLGTVKSVTYTNKIRQCPNVGFAIFGAAGIGTLFEEFMELLPQTISRRYNWMMYQNERLLAEHERVFGNNLRVAQPPLMNYTYVDLKQDCVELLTDMKNRHSVAFSNRACQLDVLLAVAIKDEFPKLWYINTVYCLPADVNEILMIGEGELAEVFRNSWKPEMTMEQTAKLSILAIKYIEKQQISEGIGVGNQQPQVWFVPKGAAPEEVTPEEINKMVTDVNSKLVDLEKIINPFS
jgi:20S proteasome alpha/beta subunit